MSATTGAAPRVGAAPTDSGLPPHFAVRLSPRAHLCADGRTLVGGTAGGVLRLRDAAVGRVRADAPVLAADTLGALLCRRLLDAGFADPVGGDGAGDAAVRDVTVVVPVRDRPGDLAALLGGLPAGVPVVVVDDGSRDAAAVAAVAAEHGARLLVHPVNRGPAAARNTGLRACATPYVVFCDSDVVPVPGWLATLHRHLDDPALAAVAPRVAAPPPAPGDGWLDRYERVRSSLDLGAVPAAVRPGGTVAYVPSACLLARVAALGDGFDESMRVAEDVDLAWRLVAAGWRVRYEPAAVVRHRHRTRCGPWLRRKAFYGTGAAPLAARHGTAVAPMVLAPWSAAVTVALLAQRRWSLPVAGAATGLAWAGLARRLRGGDRPVRGAARLTARGLVATVEQTGGALLRHHWPVAVVAAVGSRRARRALAVAALVEGWVDHRRHGAGTPLAGHLLAHRLDDLGYGAGLWWGAWRRRSAAALLPALRVPGPRSRPPARNTQDAV